MRIRTRLFCIYTMLIMMSAGCNGQFLPGFAAQSTPAINPTPGPSITPVPTLLSIPATPTNPAPTNLLTIWLPPQFAPAGGTPGGDLLQERLATFVEQNPGVKINVRIKASDGPGGLLDSLSTASAAAPLALPSLVILTRADMENAALKGLIFPVDGLSKTINDPDWYEYARQLAQVQGSTFGVPMAGDTLLLLYRPVKIGTPPVDWPGLLALGQPLVFPAEDPNASLTLNLYQSAGAQVEDSQHRPILDSEVLGKVLKLYADGAQSGVFPYWLAQYQTDAQAWQAYHDQRAQWLITWSSRYLTELPADTSAMPIPTLGNEPFTLANGWLVALSDPIPERRALSMKLIEFLTESEFLAKWSAAIDYLPTRPTSLAAWPNQSLRSILSQVALSARISPSNDLAASLGPILEDATLQVIKRQSDPVQAAQAAAEKLNPSK
jgi:multiple sugar transport system substrate-binding protein